jgi:uncharacterized protein (DUF4415 family)
MKPPRRTDSAFDRAEAVFKPAKNKPAEPVQRTNSIPEGKEMVSLRLDRAVLEYIHYILDRIRSPRSDLHTPLA